MRKLAQVAAVVTIPLMLFTGTANAGWFDPNSDESMQKMQEQLMIQAWNAVGMPAVTNFAERRQLKQIYELRDQNVATYTYLVGMDGKVGQKLCDSVGFGISAATQYTNPQRIDYNSHGAVALPQADPNGLFSPATADGTWVLCISPETKKATPLYVEPKVIVSTFRLRPE